MLNSNELEENANNWSIGATIPLFAQFDVQTLSKKREKISNLSMISLLKFHIGMRRKLKCIFTNLFMYNVIVCFHILGKGYMHI